MSGWIDEHLTAASGTNDLIDWTDNEDLTTADWADDLTVWTDDAGGEDSNCGTGVKQAVLSSNKGLSPVLCDADCLIRRRFGSGLVSFMSILCFRPRQFPLETFPQTEFITRSA